MPKGLRSEVGYFSAHPKFFLPKYLISFASPVKWGEPFPSKGSAAHLGRCCFSSLYHLQRDFSSPFASLMLLRGGKPKVISEALGHSSVAFTMDVYSHIINGMQEDAMALLDEVLSPGVNGAKNKITSPNYRQIDAEVSLK